MKKSTPVILLTAIGLSWHAGAQTAFPTGTNVAIAKPGMNNAAKNYTIYTSTNAASATFTSVTTFIATNDLNGIGINPADNLVYAASYTGNSNSIATAFDVSLKRVGMDGTVVDLGLLPLSGGAGSGATEFVNFSAGTVATNGAYYYMTYAMKPGVAIRIAGRVAFGLQPDLTANDLRMFLCWKNNVSSLPANPGASMAGGVSGSYELDFSNPDVTAAINAFLAQVNASYPNVFNADGGIQDFAINPVDTKVYGYISYPSGANTVGRPVVMNTPAAGVSAITPVGTTVNAVPGQEVAGVQFDATGNFYGLFTTGDYAQINLSTGALSGLTMSNVTTSGGNLRGDLAPAVTNIPFPVKMVSFEGKQAGAVNELSWITASEQNNKAFTIERSADSRSWTAIGTLDSKAANGSSEARLDYTFTDNSPLNGMNYYRLQQTDRDGKTALLPRYVLLTTVPGSGIRIFPNPATDMLYISGARNGMQIRLTDLTGKVLATISSSTTTDVLRLDIHSLPANIYLVQTIENGSISSAVKFVKK